MYSVEPLNVDTLKSGHLLYNQDTQCILFSAVMSLLLFQSGLATGVQIRGTSEELELLPPPCRLSFIHLIQQISQHLSALHLLPPRSVGTGNVHYDVISKLSQCLHSFGIVTRSIHTARVLPEVDPNQFSLPNRFVQGQRSVLFEPLSHFLVTVTVESIPSDMRKNEKVVKVKADILLS